MTQGELPLAVQRKAGLSLVDRLALFFRERPNVWIDGRDLAKIAGAYAWRSRVSDARRQWHMTIENRERKIRTEAQTQFTISEYRYVPKEFLTIDEGRRIFAGLKEKGGTAR